MPSSSQSLSFRQNPRIYFLLFLISNTVISYSTFSMESKCVIGLLGVFLPLYTAFRTSSPLSRTEKPGYLSNLNLAIPVWLWTLALLSLVFLRFYQLETFSKWPNLDEGWNGILALELSKNWTWKFFYTFGDAPPLPVWCAAILFKAGASPALSLWLPSALVSLFTVAAGYFAARQFFSASFSLLLGGLLAFSYWPLFISRFCHQGIWLPFWVCLVLFFWGGFQKTPKPKTKRIWAFGLGLSLGFGSFTFTPWIGVAGFFFLTFAWSMVARPKKDPLSFTFFLSAFILSLIPFLLAVQIQGFGRHIVSLSPWGGWFKSFHFISTFFKYFAVLLWDSYEKDPAYTPVWGGFLNPLLGAFFWVGILEMFHLRRFELIRWTALAFVLFLLPGALSPNLETFRVAQVLPILLFITALGITNLAALLPASKRLWILAGLFAFTGACDFNLLAAPYRYPENHPENFGRPLKSLERYRAWQILKRVQAEQGPVLPLTLFDNDAMNDPTLFIMTSDIWDAAAKQTPRWVSIYADIHYEPFLKKRFPLAAWYWPGKNLQLDNGGNLLAVIPFSSIRPRDFENWISAHHLFLKADFQRFSQNSGRQDKSVEILSEWRTQSDPFLESVYWDKRAAYEYENLNYEEQLRSYQMAVTQGYPTADLYFKLGELYRVKGRLKEAEAAYLKAVQAPLDLTQARAMLEWLKEQPSQNSPVKKK